MDCKQKWDNLRGTYRTNLKKIREKPRSGSSTEEAEEQRTVKWVHFTEMEFLRPVVSCKAMKSNLRDKDNTNTENSASISSTGANSQPSPVSVSLFPPGQNILQDVVVERSTEVVEKVISQETDGEIAHTREEEHQKNQGTDGGWNDTYMQDDIMNSNFDDHEETTTCNPAFINSSSSAAAAAAAATASTSKAPEVHQISPLILSPNTSSSSAMTSPVPQAQQSSPLLSSPNSSRNMTMRQREKAEERNRQIENRNINMARNELLQQHLQLALSKRTTTAPTDKSTPQEKFLLSLAPMLARVRLTKISFLFHR